MTTRIVFILLCLLSCFSLQAQDVKEPENKVSENPPDLLYREDQFYFSITYNLLNNMPNGMSQSGFSTGVQLGFIRDFPINTRRNVAIGIGLGYSGNGINQNLAIEETTQNNYQYQLLTNETYSKNKLELHVVELPIEFRWRTSTPTEYNFWRIYTGIKFGYVFASTYKYKGEPQDSKLSSPNDLNDFQYGLTLSAGFDQFNAHIYYGLNNLFNNNAELNGNSLDFNLIKIGLIIYIL